ncbi:MAG: hypothetical protein D6689_11675 [Deltaproteobacteria bacterium]|nr:MAG: hypothetical protein D6689_11675 [Deltaproteobacteria bacterium]
MRALRVVVAAAIFGCGCNFYLPDELSHPDEIPVEHGSQPPECAVAAVEPLPDCAEPDVSADGATIGCARLVDGAYEVFVMNADGTDERCLTCTGAPPELAGKHKGNPEFHASGRYIVITAENERGSHTAANTPGIGTDNDFWAIDVDTGTYTRLTRIPERAALQWPWFSRDGSEFVWSQRYERGRIWEQGNEFGRWRIHIARFDDAAGAPAFTDVETLQPAGDRPYYEPHDFTPDRSKLLMSANLEPGSSQAVLDIYTVDLATGETVNLTNSPWIHDEMAVFSPDGARIALMSGPFAGFATFGYKADLYLMDADGENFVRLTRFNDPDDPSYLGGPVQIAQAVWEPGGRSIVFAIWVHAPEPYAQHRMYRLRFAGACGGG